MLAIPEHMVEAIKRNSSKYRKTDISTCEYRYYKIAQMAQNTGIRYPGILVLQSSSDYTKGLSGSSACCLYFGEHHDAATVNSSILRGSQACLDIHSGHLEQLQF
ncbi:hypothetical protein TNCV_30771 [Trichonephila clavipes]|nr:hypothetical protein TNCV_30771 [Trichonephila clavipes]